MGLGGFDRTFMMSALMGVHRIHSLYVMEDLMVIRCLVIVAHSFLSLIVLMIHINKSIMVTKVLVHSNLPRCTCHIQTRLMRLLGQVFLMRMRQRLLPRWCINDTQFIIQYCVCSSKIGIDLYVPVHPMNQYRHSSVVMNDLSTLIPSKQVRKIKKYNHLIWFILNSHEMIYLGWYVFTRKTRAWSKIMKYLSNMSFCR